MVVLAENKDNSAPLELELGLSLAKMVTCSSSPRLVILPDFSDIFKQAATG